MCAESLSDDESVYRRIPPGETWLDWSGNITSGNFKVRHKAGELGISVYRASRVTPAEVLAKPDAIAGSRVAVATVLISAGWLTTMEHRSILTW